MVRKNFSLVLCTLIGGSLLSMQPVVASVDDGWINNNGAWYYYDNGLLKTGWLEYKGNWYYLANTDTFNNYKKENDTFDINKYHHCGAMLTGWLNISGNKYYMNSTGIMKIGWIKDNENWYYLDESGAMLGNTHIDGYRLGIDGAWIEADNNDNLEDVTMKTEKSTYDILVEKIKINITNNTNHEINYGVDYQIEKIEDNNWVKVPFKNGVDFIEVANILKPRATNTEYISLDKLEKHIQTGRYRILKFNKFVSAEFEIR